jgi:hypothetical protein
VTSAVERPPIGPFDTAVSEPTVRGSHVFFYVTVPRSVAERGQGLGSAERICKAKGFRFVDAERIGRDGRTWRVKAMASGAGART